MLQVFTIITGELQLFVKVAVKKDRFNQLNTKILGKLKQKLIFNFQINPKNGRSCKNKDQVR